MRVTAMRATATMARTTGTMAMVTMVMAMATTRAMATHMKVMQVANVAMATHMMATRTMAMTPRNTNRAMATATMMMEDMAILIVMVTAIKRATSLQRLLELVL